VRPVQRRTGYVPPYYPSTLPQLEDREFARSRGYPHISGVISPKDELILEGTKKVLEAFFATKSKKFGLVDYRRLLIFVKCMAEAKKSESLESIFESLGLQNNVENEDAVSWLLELLHAEVPDFAETHNKRMVSELWGDLVLREIGKVEKRLGL